jgi:hypothetical protein
VSGSGRRVPLPQPVAFKNHFHPDLRVLLFDMCPPGTYLMGAIPCGEPPDEPPLLLKKDGARGRSPRFSWISEMAADEQRTGSRECDIRKTS